MRLSVSGGDLQRLRRLNALNAVSALRTSGPMTLTRLAERADLARATVKEVVKDLVDQGWVAEMEPSDGEKGRPARRYRFRAEAGRVLGLDIGAHKVLAIIADLDGAVLHTARVPTAPELAQAGRLAAIDRAVGRCLDGAGVPASDVWATVAGSTGYVDLGGRVVMSAAIKDWAGVPLAGHLGESLPGDVLVENDSRLAALAECRRGVAQDTGDMVFLHVGPRPGAAVVIDGVPLRGAGGAAGEIGLHPLFHLGQLNEQLQAASAVPAGTSAEDVAGVLFGAARQGDKEAQNAVLRYVKTLALAAAAMALTVDPEVVVLGGGFSRSADVLLGPLRAELETLCLRTPQVRASTLGDECVALGAVCCAVEHLNGRLFDQESGPLDPLTPTMIREQ